jgi:hypothetical protein
MFESKFRRSKTGKEYFLLIVAFFVGLIKVSNGDLLIDGTIITSNAEPTSGNLD